MKKPLLKALNERADALPMLVEVDYWPALKEKRTQLVRFLSGHELLNNCIDEVNGLPVVPTALYPDPTMLVTNIVNHRRRLREAFEKEGIEGIKSYEGWVETIVKQSA